MDQVEKVLYNYRSLIRASKRLKRRAEYIDDGVKSGYSVDNNSAKIKVGGKEEVVSITAGKVSHSYNQKNTVQDSAIRNDNLLCRAKKAEEKANEIIEDVENLKSEKFGDEMVRVIEMKYLYSRDDEGVIAREVGISERSVWRRRDKALELLKQGGLHLLHGEIMSII